MAKYDRPLGAFINLESTGPGGPDYLFQHTGGSAAGMHAHRQRKSRGWRPALRRLGLQRVASVSLRSCAAGGWTVAAYARSAKHPRGAVIGQDIFESGATLPLHCVR